MNDAHAQTRQNTRTAIRNQPIHSSARAERDKKSSNRYSRKLFARRVRVTRNKKPRPKPGLKFGIMLVPPLSCRIRAWRARWCRSTPRSGINKRFPH